MASFIFLIRMIIIILFAAKIKTHISIIITFKHKLRLHLSNMNSPMFLSFYLNCRISTNIENRFAALKLINMDTWFKIDRWQCADDWFLINFYFVWGHCQSNPKIMYFNINVTQPYSPVLHREDLGSGFVMPCIDLLHGSSCNVKLGRVELNTETLAGFKIACNSDA